MCTYRPNIDHSENSREGTAYDRRMMGCPHNLDRIDMCPLTGCTSRVQSSCPGRATSRNNHQRYRSDISRRRARICPCRCSCRRTPAARRTRRRSNQARRRSALRGNTHGPSSLSRTPPRCSRAPTSLCDESESWARVSNDGVRGARTCGSRGARQTLAGRGHMMRSVCIARTVAAGALAGGRVAPPVRAALGLLPRAPAHAAIRPVERCIALARALDARAAIRARAAGRI